MDREIKKQLASILRHRVNVQSATRANDGEGGVVTTWTATLSNVAASVDPIQARQQFQYKSINVDATHIVKMRGDVAVNEKQQITWGARTFEILTVEDINESGVMKFITTKERR